MDTVAGTLELFVQKNKNKTLYYVNYTNLKGKTVRMVLDSPAVCFYPEDAKNGVAVSIVLGGDQKPVKVTIEGKPEVKPRIAPPPVAKKQPDSSRSSSGFSSYRQSPSSPALKISATAPYNFVPYDPAKTVSSNYAPTLETFSGSLRCRLEALTPLLVAANMSALDSDKSKEKHFLRVNDVNVIPGSSLKGLFRSTIETLSYSSLTQINSNYLYYRDFTKEKYKSFFGTVDSSKQKAGWFVKEGADYFIYPVEFLGSNDPKAVVVEVNKLKGGTTPYYFGNFSTAGQPIQVDKDIESQFCEQITPKQNEYLFKRIGIKDIYSFSSKHRLPVFYIEKSGANEIQFLGLPKFFRVPYDYRPDQLILVKEKEGNQAILEDFTRRLFGYADPASARKGRISFSHAEVSGAESEKGHIVTLGKPNVTCLAHYLAQNNASKPSNYSDYNRKDARIRGRKFYWHRNWETEPGKLPRGNEKTDNVLFPIEAGAQGYFTVNLSRLTLVELGAVFLALELWPDSAHKLGLGKPIGLGSVRITIESIDVKPFSQQYRSLSARLSGQSKQTEQDISVLKEKSIAAFKNYIRQAVTSTSSGTSYEQLPEISAFKAIVDYKNRPDNTRTKYLDLKEFKSKNILPQILEIYR